MKISELGSEWSDGVFFEIHVELNDKDTLGELMLKTENYLQSFWKQLMAWRNDGNYSIDNNLAERSIRMTLLELKIQLHLALETISALLQEAITYLDNAWKEVFAYRQNGDFTIDNMAAERAIKPVSNQRKNSLFYCSESGARNAATFNTFIQTCKQMGVPFMSYFKKVMNELKNGRTDYENLLPATIQL